MHTLRLDQDMAAYGRTQDISCTDMAAYDSDLCLAGCGRACVVHLKDMAPCGAGIDT